MIPNVVSSSTSSVRLLNITSALRPSLPALTGIRFFAAAMIVALHIGDNPFGLPSEWAVSSYLRSHLDSGVPFFFVLSGFVLFYNYPTLETATARGRYMVARFARLWPAHVAALAMLLLGLPNTQIAPNDTGHFVANLLMVHAWIPRFDYIFSYNSPSWSVSHELGLYIFFLLLIPGFERNFPIKLAVTIVLAGILLYFSHNSLAILGNPVMSLFGFTCGMTAAVIWMRYPSTIQRRIAASIFEFSALVLFLGAGIVTDYLAEYLQSDVGYWLGKWAAPSLTASVLVWALAKNRGVLSWILATAPIMLLGEMSYSIYLFHVVILQIIISHHLLSFSPTLNLTAYLVLVLATSYIVWRWIEKPARAFIVSIPTRVDTLFAKPQRTGPTCAGTSTATQPVELNRSRSIETFEVSSVRTGIQRDGRSA
jgi:peptidoglycan/LPS O-acetylase OafA/YrhL